MPLSFSKQGGPVVAGTPRKPKDTKGGTRDIKQGTALLLKCEVRSPPAVLAAFLEVTSELIFY